MKKIELIAIGKQEVEKIGLWSNNQIVRLMGESIDKDVLIDDENINIAIQAFKDDEKDDRYVRISVALSDHRILYEFAPLVVDEIYDMKTKQFID